MVVAPVMIVGSVERPPPLMEVREKFRRVRNAKSPGRTYVKCKGGGGSRTMGVVNAFVLTSVAPAAFAAPSHASVPAIAQKHAARIFRDILMSTLLSMRPTLLLFTG